MHLERTSSGVWYARIKLNGRWTRRSLKTTNKREAQRNLAKLDLSGQKQERLAGAVKRWLREQEQRPLTEKHLAEVRRTMRELVADFGALRVEDIKRGKLLPWLQEKPRRLRLTRAFFRWCIAEDLRQTDPCLDAVRYIKRPEVKRTPRLSDTQIEALLADLKEHAPKLYPLVKFLSETGVRSVDAARLRWKDVGEGRVLIKPGKGKGHTRLIPATVDLAPGHPEALVFGLNKSQLEGAWRRFKKRHGHWAGTSLHSLRVSVNSRLVEQGQEALARAMLGHSSADMTAHYTRLHGA
jgi:integrase